MSALTEIILSEQEAVRDSPIDGVCQQASVETLLAECEALHSFQESDSNLYRRVRALVFLAAIHRYHLPEKLPDGASAAIPYEGHTHLLHRRYEEAIASFLNAQRMLGPAESISSALAAAYRGLAFQTLAEQVRHSVRSIRGNQWMFRSAHVDDYPLRLHPALLTKQDGLFPVLAESTPVRMDLSHSGWSDIFFLGMDYPEGARVLNVSVDLTVRDGASAAPRPPVEAYLRVIDEPVLRLVSVDLKSQVDVSTLDECFDFARDYLGLLKAAVIASGLVPAGMEGSGQSLQKLLTALTGSRGMGIEIVSKVNDIPKGSRLAVSTNLLACLITACMRATGQICVLDGPLEESDRRLVAARAILGEWLGGSGGGWQDSGGVWPGIKLIQGVAAVLGDVEYGVSRGCLLPSHTILERDRISDDARRKLENSLVLVHGGMAQDVGPILEMVTEKYLLRSMPEWQGRQRAHDLFDQIVEAMRAGDTQRIGACTQENFDGPIQTIIPWAANQYTETLIHEVRNAFGAAFHGFWMLGGMSGGGMGFIFDPSEKSRALSTLPGLMQQIKKRMEHAVPFAMDPVVYDFAINDRGTSAMLLRGSGALLPAAYYTLVAPPLLRQEVRGLTPARRAELVHMGVACQQRQDFTGMVPALIEHLLPHDDESARDVRGNLDDLLRRHGFDSVQHEAVRADLRAGRVGLMKNTLHASTRVENVGREEIVDSCVPLGARYAALGRDALAADALAVVSLSGGVGSRWTHGAGVVKAINPFCKLAGAYRSFLEVHLAKSRRACGLYRSRIPHVFTTSYLTHQPIAEHLAAHANHGYDAPICLSAGRTIGLRLVPMVRDLRFLWEQTPQQLLDERKQKVRESMRSGLLQWATQMGEGSDYRDNSPMQCLHPVGHWYEIPNMLLNGTLTQLIAVQPGLKHLLLHNIDTLGADVDPALFGLHLESGAMLTSEVVSRSLEDRGGGLARVDGRLRLIEGLALPDESLELSLSYYNSGTMWISIEKLLDFFGLHRQSLIDPVQVLTAVRRAASRMPTYITLKDVKKRWGKGHEDVLPVAQFEKLWGDMTALQEVETQYVLVPRRRGQQLKDVAQLDPWMRDGSAAHVAALCDWNGG
ncbi:MAG: UTP--glucose-1-phosphate uridylyltransferase [Bryobacterales bacterium]|nr:UTP--glucose-1-phosphate uridylyltransferase [Bryobacterales bacterium]